MRLATALVLTLGAAALAAAQQPIEIRPPQPTQELPPVQKLPGQEHREPLAAGQLDLVGMPIGLPPISAWPVGEAVEKLEPGTRYVFVSFTRSLGFLGGLKEEDVRYFLGALQKKYEGRVVVIEVMHRDNEKMTMAGVLADSAAKNPDVRTRVAVCDGDRFAEWCGSKRRPGAVCAVVNDRGELACVVERHADLPWVLDQLIAGKLDCAAYQRKVAAARAVLDREPVEREGLAWLERIDEAAALTAWRDLATLRAKALREMGRVDEAAAAARAALEGMVVVDRDLLKNCIKASRPEFGQADAMTPVALDAAQRLAATSEMTNVQELVQVAEIAGAMRDYDTAIMYQTMAVARAPEGSGRAAEAMAALRKYEAARGK